jgi:hypothetical protein
MIDYQKARDELMKQLGKRGLAEWTKKLPGEYVMAIVDTVNELWKKEHK